MTALDLDFVRNAARKSAAPGPVRSLGKMTMLQMARRTVIFTVDAAGIASLMDAAREDIPGLTSNGIVQAVANHNPLLSKALGIEVESTSPPSISKNSRTRTGVSSGLSQLVVQEV